MRGRLVGVPGRGHRGCRGPKCAVNVAGTWQNQGAAVAPARGVREGLPVSRLRRVGARAKVAQPAPGACSRQGPQVLRLLWGYF